MFLNSNIGKTYMTYLMNCLLENLTYLNNLMNLNYKTYIPNLFWNKF